MFMEEFDTNQDGKVSWEEFRSAMGKLKERVAAKAQNAKEYKSFNKMRDDRVKHKRMDKELNDKYKLPMTFNQSVGFYTKDKTSMDIIKQQRRPINKCAETKYAEEMIKTGIHFS